MLNDGLQIVKLIVDSTLFKEKKSFNQVSSRDKSSVNVFKFFHITTSSLTHKFILIVQRMLHSVIM